MHIFYTPNISSHKHILSEEESKHCVKVLRLNIDDEINLIDGKGNFFVAKIVDAHPKRCLVEVVSKQENFGKRNFTLHIAVAPTKNINRFETFLEKATEIGVDKIIPILSRYSERKVIKKERLEKVVLSATKQSLKAYLPELSDMQKFKDILDINFAGQKFIAHCYNMPKTDLKNAYKKGENVFILIGPEGDFSEKEVETAIEKGFIPVNLSASRLRTETAGIVAVNIIDFVNT